jgi:hypothetical protein
MFNHRNTQSILRIEHLVPTKDLSPRRVLTQLLTRREMSQKLKHICNLIIIHNSKFDDPVSVPKNIQSADEYSFRTAPLCGDAVSQPPPRALYRANRLVETAAVLCTRAFSVL